MNNSSGTLVAAAHCGEPSLFVATLKATCGVEHANSMFIEITLKRNAGYLCIEMGTPKMLQKIGRDHNAVKRDSVQLACPSQI